MDETVLSKIIHGYRNPTMEQRKLLADYLAVDEAWLFECFETTTRHPVSENAQADTGSKLAGNEDL